MRLAHKPETWPEQHLGTRVNYNSELVGNENVFEALKRGIECILLYDTKARTNVMNDYGFSKTFLITGEPGCGKTTAIRAAVKYGMELSAKISKMLFVTNIGNKFKNEYYSRSAQELRKIFNVFFSGSQINIGIIEDIDTVFFRRNQLINAEDSANLGELLNLLEGVETVNLGNYIILATANKRFEPALEQRFECVLEAKGPETAEHYEKLLRINIKNLEQFIDYDLKNAAEILSGKKFSGRDVRNICRKIASEINSFEASAEFYSLEPAKQKKFIEGNFCTVSEEQVMEIIREYERK